MQSTPSDEAIGRVFTALSDPTRRAFVARLAAGEAAISDLAATVDISLPAVSRHVRVLHEAGLVRREKRGRTTYLSLEREALESASAWIERTAAFWEDALDRLAEFVEER